MNTIKALLDKRDYEGYSDYINKLLLFIIVALFASCKSELKETKNSNFIESHPAFFELHNGNWLVNSWIRKPANLLMVHETFRKFGYQKLLLNEMASNPIIRNGIYINKMGKNLLDSLAISYQNPKITDSYYIDFWKRREKENNEKIVCKILLEIKSASEDPTKTKTGLNVKVNDTLLSLLEVEYGNKIITPNIAIANFNKLKKLGFNQSAYNLLYECTNYENVKWDRDILEN
jgi:glutamyl/glutaminyl-tRNA synthetase